MSYKEMLEEANKDMMNVAQSLPDEMKGFMQLHNAALEDKALDPKMKELIALGISIAVKCVPCIVSHITSLIELGVTREEVVETVGVALFMGGGPSVAYGGKVLSCYDELIDSKHE